MDKMKELSKAGVRRVQQMQSLINYYVTNQLFAGQLAPPMSDARYWPSNKVVLNCIYRTTKTARYV